MEELVDFFPDERSRAALRRVIAAGREVRTKLLDACGDDARVAQPGRVCEQLDQFVDELAGIIGIDPGPFTLRQLVVMAEAKSRQAWNHTSAILAMLANVHRDAKKTRAYRPADFHPHRRHEKPTITKVAINVLKQVFVDRQPGD